MKEKEEIENPHVYPSSTFDLKASKRVGAAVWNNHKKGMTLRDYFAAKAMQGELSTFGREGHVISVEKLAHYSTTNQKPTNLVIQELKNLLMNFARIL